MLRATLVQAILELKQIIHESEVDLLEQELVVSPSATREVEILRRLSEFGIGIRIASPEAEALAHAFGLGALAAPSVWRDLMKEHGNEEGLLRGKMIGAVSAALGTIPILVNFLSSDAHSRDELEFRTDRGEGTIATEDLIRLLESVSLLHEVAAVTSGQPRVRPVVMRLDSGTSFTIVFAGMFLKKVGEWLLEMYERVATSKARIRTSNAGAVRAEAEARQAQNQLLRESLPALLEIDELFKRGVIDGDEAARLRKQAIDGATGVLAVGASTPEMGASDWSKVVPVASLMSLVRGLLPPPHNDASESLPQQTDGDGE